MYAIEYESRYANRLWFDIHNLYDWGGEDVERGEIGRLFLGDYLWMAVGTFSQRVEGLPAYEMPRLDADIHHRGDHTVKAHTRADLRLIADRRVRTGAF